MKSQWIVKCKEIYSRYCSERSTVLQNRLGKWGGLRSEALQCAARESVDITAATAPPPPLLYQEIYGTHLHVDSTQFACGEKTYEKLRFVSVSDVLSTFGCTSHGSRKFEYTSNAGFQVYGTFWFPSLF
jgi:hypothetical protein